MRSTKSPSWIERLLGLAPLPAPPHVFALSADELLYARLPQRDGGERWLAIARRAALRPGAFGPGPLGGELRDPASLEEALTEVLAAAGDRVEEATLVVPDDWCRLTSFDVGELPSGRDARREVLRWKLKRIVPVPMEELRIAEVEVRRNEAGDSSRVTVAFGREPLLAAIERMFSDRGIHLGRVVPRTAALVPAVVDATREAGPWALASVTAGGYTLAFAPGPGPAVFRAKTVDPGADPDRVRPSVLQDLRLTRAFVREQLGSDSFREVFLVAPEDVRPRWASWLEEGLGVAPLLVVSRSLPASDVTLPVEDAGPLVGAVLEEIR